MKNIRVFKTKAILNILSIAINNNKPFGLVRFGDGTIKAIHAFLNKDEQQLKDISFQEGIPIMMFDKIIDLWKTSANNCNYIDTPEVYFNGKFWMRTKKINKEKISEKTTLRLKMWLDLYRAIGINNESYCNPEINFLSCLGRNSLPDILKGKKICCITARDDAWQLSNFFDIDIVKIAGKHQQQFIRSFSKVVDLIIDTSATKYDLWLIAAGELGRVYPGLIKFKGGRAFDVGSLIDVWCGDELPSRLQAYMSKTKQHPLKFILTDEGRKYSSRI